ncbi:MAG: spore germination protein GerW family protein [Caldilineaceae bacterium]
MGDFEQSPSGERPGESTVGTGFFSGPVNSVEQTQALIGRALTAAEPGGVFGTPLERGEYTIITCSEVAGGLGAGFGTGVDEKGVGGNGGGGGGGSMGRPVAVITIGPRGVEVQPVFDMTKVGIAAVAAIGALFLSWGRMKRG